MESPCSLLPFFVTVVVMIDCSKLASIPLETSTLKNTYFTVFIVSAHDKCEFYKKNRPKVTVPQNSRTPPHLFDNLVRTKLDARAMDLSRVKTSTSYLNLRPFLA